MQGNSGFEAVEEAYHAMSPEAAEEYRVIGRHMAEQFPRVIKMELVASLDELRELRSLASIGRLSPTGMFILNWTSRAIVWCNAAFARFFNAINPLIAVSEAEIPGLHMEEFIPDFSGSQHEAIYAKVAATLEPFAAEQYALLLPSAGMTFWDWSLTPLPCSATGATLLLVQANRSQAPLKLAVA